MWFMRIVWFAIALAVWTTLSAFVALGFAAILCVYWLYTGLRDYMKPEPETRPDGFPTSAHLQSLADRYNRDAEQAARSRVKVRRHAGVRARARSRGKGRVS